METKKVKVKLSDALSWGLPGYNLVVDEGFKKPNKQTTKLS